MNTKKRVYIAGALNADAVQYIKNCSLMMEHAEKVRKAGFAVLVPCLDYLMGLKFGYWEYHDYFENSQPWLDAADAVYVCPGSENSEGTKKEIERAKEKGIPVYYTLPELSAGLKLGEF